MTVFIDSSLVEILDIIACFTITLSFGLNSESENALKFLHTCAGLYA